MKEKMRVLSEGTLIPISFLITLLGGSGFVTYLYFQTSANAKTIETLQGRQEISEEMRADIAVIKNDVQTMKVELYKRNAR